jgi:PII-like signaling protein
VNDDCLKRTTYFGERHRTEDQFVADALLDLYGRNEVEVSVVLRGAAGFGLKHHLRTDRILTLSEDLPLVSVAVDRRPRIESLLDEVISIKRHGLITLERARMLAGDVGAVALPEELHEATKLTVYVGRQERIYGVPAFVGVCDLLHHRGIAGATVLLGVDGTVHAVRERARFFGRNAEVPMMIIAVGAGEQIARVLPELGGLLRRPLLTLERVLVCKRDDHLLARPTSIPAADEARPGRVAEADCVRVRAGAPRPSPAARGARPPPARERRERSDLPARGVGLPRRPRAARRPPAATAPPRPGGDDHRRHPRADRGLVSDRR